MKRPEIFGSGEEEEEEEDDPMSREEPVAAHSHDHHGHSHSHDEPPTRRRGFHSPPAGQKYKPSEHDMDKLRSTLKQFVRDWSLEGRTERAACYEPMKESLLAHFNDKTEVEKAALRVLVPGAGLGRLAFDIANLGMRDGSTRSID